MNTGNWNIEVNTNGMPQKVASAFTMVNETLVGAEYEFIAYLGDQLVNGTNHAVLAKQIVTTGRDTENVVVMQFNEKPKEMEATLIGIEHVVDGGMELGGTEIDIREIGPDDGTEASKVWYEAFEGFVGISMRPIVYLGKQVVNGVNYIYAATMEPMTLEGTKQAVVITINPREKVVKAVDMLEPKQINALNYTFTW